MGYPLAQHSRGPSSILFSVFLFIRFPLASHLIPCNSHRLTIFFHLLVHSIQLSHSCPGSSLTVYLHSPSSQPLCANSRPELCEEINRDPTPRFSADMPEEKEDKGTLFGLMFQRFLFYARASTHRLLYTSFCEFYIGRIKRRERYISHEDFL